MSLNISFQPEYVAEVAGFQLTNSLLTSFLVTALLAALGIIVYFREKNRGDRPRGLLARLFRYLVFEMLKLTESVVGSRQRAEAVLPLITTFFVFIMTANLLALLPGFLGSFYVLVGGQELPLLRSSNSDLNTTLALALVAVLATQWFSLKAIGFRHYLRRFFDFRGPVRLMMGFFELLSEAVKVLSFSFRLFGNIFAGEVLLLVIAFLVPYLVPVPFMVLEVFVGVIQAFIFSMLTLTFIRTASVDDLMPAKGQR